MNKLITAVSAALLMGVLTGVADTYTWSAIDRTILPNDGAVTVTYDGDTANITSLSATPAVGGTITIAGDAMTFADDATISLAASGTVSFASAVTTLGKLTVKRGDGMYLSWVGDDTGSHAYLPTYVESLFELFTHEDIGDTSLDDWETVSSALRANPVHTGITTQGIMRKEVANASDVFSETGVRYRHDTINLWTGQYTYSFRLQLRKAPEANSGIMVRILSGTQSLQYLDVAEKTDVYKLRDKGLATAATWFSSDHSSKNGIGIDQLTIRRKGAGNAVVRFDGGATFGGETVVGVGAEAVLGVFGGDSAATLTQPVGGEGIFRIVAAPSASTGGVVTVANSCTMMNSAGTLIFGGEEKPLTATVTSTSAFPTNGLVRVCTNADVKISVSGLNVGTGVSGGKSVLRIEKGGIVRRSADGQIGSSQLVEILGGTLSNTGGSYYLNYLTLAAGGRVTASSTTPPRAVFNNIQYWHIKGTEPVFVDSGVRIYGVSKSATGTFRIDVDDVTGSEDVDCTLSRVFNHSSYPNFTFNKYGEGTLKLTGDSRVLIKPTTLYGGTFILGGSNILTNDIVLSGGSLAAADSAQNSKLASLTANTNASISVGTGGLLAFKSFSAAEGLAEKSIIIDAPLAGNVLRIGTNGNGLTSDQLKCFRWRDNSTGKLLKVKIDNSGYLHPIIVGTVILVQ